MMDAQQLVKALYNYYKSARAVQTECLKRKNEKGEPAYFPLHQIMYWCDLIDEVQYNKFGKRLRY